MSAPESIGYWSAVGLVLCGFWFVLTRALRAEGYSLPAALGIGLVSLAQPAYVEAAALRTALFSVATFGVAWTSAALVQRQEPRRIVLLGSSLAGAQFLHPLCGTATTLILPFALRQSLARAGIRHGTGLYISLLFIPALAFVYWSIAQPELSAVIALPQRLSGPFPPMALASLAAAVPITFAVTRIRRAIALPTIVVIATVAGVGVFGALLGFQQPNVTAAALAALSTFVASCWPDTSNRTLNTAALAMANLAVSWTLALYTGWVHA
jgi:hypothetical protein